MGAATDNLLDAARQANLIEKIPGLGHAAKATADFTFHTVQPAYMLQVGRLAFARNKAANPHMSEAEVFRKSVKETNEFYGNMGTQGFLKNKTFQDAAKLLLFAPGFTEGRARTEARGIGQGARTFADGVRGKGWRVGTAARAMGKMILAMLIGNQVINLFSRGKPTWENEEEGHRWDAWIPDFSGKGRGFFFSPFSMATEFSHEMLKYMEGGESALDAAAHIGNNKLSGGARAAKDLLTGHDGQGRPFASTGERVKAAALDLSPLPMQTGALLQKDPGGKAGHGPVHDVPSAIDKIASYAGYKYNRQPGSIEKQLFGMFGIKLENAQSARAQMYRAAAPFRMNGGGAHAASPYGDLRHLLDNGDLDGAGDEVRRLTSEGGKSLKDIGKALGLRDDDTIRPEMFTGNHKAEERMKARVHARAAQALHPGAEGAHPDCATLPVVACP